MDRDIRLDLVAYPQEASPALEAALEAALAATSRPGSLPPQTPVPLVRMSTRAGPGWSTANATTIRSLSTSLAVQR